MGPRLKPDLRQAMQRLADECGIDRYLLAEIPGDEAVAPQILSCNWTYDAAMAFGPETLARLLKSSFATFPGAAPQPAHPLMLSALLGTEAVTRLRRAGDEEIFCIKLVAGGRRHGALLSTCAAGQLTAAAAMQAQLRICHLLSDHRNEAVAQDCASPLSVREADCLRWVSQGKTTEDVAMILGVSANTINSYIAQSINKLAASNRAMATAIALRQGFI
jgi:DNA-binding CsgD family transcriptional regulator